MRSCPSIGKVRNTWPTGGGIGLTQSRGFAYFWLPALKRMGKDFISGYCQLVTGEKDPRNLRLAFSIERVMLVEFDISENVEVSSEFGQVVVKWISLNR